jgi:hypothetical protein
MLLVVAIEEFSNSDAYIHHKTPLNAIMMVKSIKKRNTLTSIFLRLEVGVRPQAIVFIRRAFPFRSSRPIPIMPNDLVVKKQVFEYLTSTNVVYNEVAAAEGMNIMFHLCFQT